MKNSYTLKMLVLAVALQASSLVVSGIVEVSDLIERYTKNPNDSVIASEILAEIAKLDSQLDKKTIARSFKINVNEVDAKIEELKTLVKNSTRSAKIKQALTNAKSKVSAKANSAKEEAIRFVKCNPGKSAALVAAVAASAVAYKKPEATKAAAKFVYGKIANCASYVANTRPAVAVYNTSALALNKVANSDVVTKSGNGLKSAYNWAASKVPAFGKKVVVAAAPAVVASASQQ
jgi:hypothetical protein